MDELEGLLRQFQPRRPRPLPEIARERRPQWPVWTAVSGFAAAVIILAIVARHDPAPAAERPQVLITLGALDARALANDDELDAVLTRASRGILPDVERSGGVLQALSKE